MSKKDSGLVFDRVSGEPLKLGEGALWYRSELLHVDINDGKVMWFNPASHSLRTIQLNGKVSAAVPAQMDEEHVLLAMDGGFYTLNRETGDVLCIATPEQGKKTRMNDGKCDPAGRFWAGSMFCGDYKMKMGTLYCLGADFFARPMLFDVTISNGIAWVGDTMYYIDSDLRTIDAFDYERGTGHISNRRTVVSMPSSLSPHSSPDGMTADADGNLWVAMHRGGCVCQFNPKSGEHLRSISIPKALHCTSVAFGGGGLEDLYVTTSSEDMTETEKSEYCHSGLVFRVRGLGVKGMPAYSFHADLLSMPVINVEGSKRRVLSQETRRAEFISS